MKAGNSYTQLSETSTYWRPHIGTHNCLACRKLKTTYSWRERMEKWVLLFRSQRKGVSMQLIPGHFSPPRWPEYEATFIRNSMICQLYTNRQRVHRWAASFNFRENLRSNHARFINMTEGDGPMSFIYSTTQKSKTHHFPMSGVHVCEGMGYP